jgi:sugar phosphate isomerase/epimerase
VSEDLTRRDWLTRSTALAGAVLMTTARPQPAAAKEADAAEPFGYCLNTSTIRGQKLSVAAEAEIAAKAGYAGFEPWIRELDEFVKQGGSLKDLGKRLSDLGLQVPSSIGFAEWIVDDPARRNKGLEQAKRDMDAVQQIGGKRMAAPPVGATDQANLDLLAAADRFRALCELGEKMGITPEAEVWGFSKPLRRLGEAMLVAMESSHPTACVLPDVYHLYKGGSDFTGLRHLRGSAIGIFHMNDYPSLERDKIKDADRVYPGDGIAPLGDVLRTLRDSGYRAFLSLELFNPEYWKQDAMLVAKTGLEKMKAVAASL